jgi:hypothetical protein
MTSLLDLFGEDGDREERGGLGLAAQESSVLGKKAAM